jgi:hypothetical protein
MAANYTVADQRPVTDAGVGGTFVPSMEITFTTKPSNITGRVRVPMAQYTPEQVDRVLAAQAEQIENVQKL